MCAEIRPKLPTPPSRSALRDNGWTQREIIELRRLAPVSEDHDQRYDFRKLRKQDVQRVINRAAEIAENEGKPVSSTIIRRAVDEDLGTERKQKQKSEPVGIDLDAYLRRHIGTIEGVIENLAQVPAGGWTQLEKSDPGLAERLAEVCDELAALLRS